MMVYFDTSAWVSSYVQGPKSKRVHNFPTSPRCSVPSHVRGKAEELALAW
jgi:hypothetical protein